jgi:23S rRNA pseudouridine2605 synthase
MTVHEGRKRQIRRMLSEVGYQVIYLTRIAQGPLLLGSLKKGKWRWLTDEEVENLKKELSLKR